MLSTIEYPYEFTYSGNPLVTHVSAADPAARVWDDTVWVYTSQDGNLLEHGYHEGDPWTYEYMDGYHVFSSTGKLRLRWRSWPSRCILTTI